LFVVTKFNERGAAQRAYDPLGMDDRPRATRDTIHRITPMPATRARVEAVDRVFTPLERKTLELGLVPKSMDDHGLVFFEDGWLYCHRSWSGICRYMIRIEDLPDGTARVGESFVNMKERMTLSKDYDVRLVRYLIERTLGNEWPFPT
jgi:hypothetical protein